MRFLVTGVAGFIGATTAKLLLDRGDDVLGVDALRPTYDIALKQRNLTELELHDRFEVVIGDLDTLDLIELFAGIDGVVHLAARAGVRDSWASGFESFVKDNVIATQRVLEAATAVGCPRLVYASSSSVYGNATNQCFNEQQRPAPHSPYGVTKLAGEHLCCVYAANHGLSTVSLRYFTVYGPRQRPDMAIHRMIESARTGQPFPLFGDGSQVRDFTYVDDIAWCNVASLDRAIAPGTVVNVAGGSEICVSRLLELVGDIVGAPVNIDQRAPSPGDVPRTKADLTVLTTLFGDRTRTPLRDGLAAQAAWHEAVSNDPTGLLGVR